MIARESLLAEIAEEFVSYIDAQDCAIDDALFAIALGRQMAERERAAERRKRNRHRREAARLARRHEETKRCPICGTEFRVLVGVDGRPRIYDRGACRKRACVYRRITGTPAL